MWSEVKWKLLSHIWLFATPWTVWSMEFSGPEYWSGYLFPSPGDIPTQGLNPGLPGLPHCRQILYQLSYKWNPRILEWVAYPFCSGSSQPRNLNQPGSPTLQADSLRTELSGKPPYQISNYKHSFIWFFLCVRYSDSTVLKIIGLPSLLSLTISKLCVYLESIDGSQYSFFFN